MSTTHQKALFPAKTIAERYDETRIPDIRLLKGHPKIRINQQTIKTLVVTVKCNANQRTVLLHLLPTLYTDSAIKFVPIAFRTKATTKQAQKQYANLLKIQNHFLAQTNSFAIVGVDEATMHSKIPSGQTVHDEILQLSTIKTIHYHQGTAKFGWWVLITTKLDCLLPEWMAQTGTVSTTPTIAPGHSRKSPIDQSYLNSLSQMCNESSKSIGANQSHNRNSR